MANFVKLGQSHALATQGTEVFVTYDALALYIGFRCVHSAATIKADASARDGAVWEDDAVELFIQPDPPRGTYYQFVGNSRGVFWDSRGTDGSWNGDWAYQTSVEAGYWCGEVRIPFSSLGMQPPQEGSAIGFNVCRDQMTPSRELSSWALMPFTFHDPARFGRLVFSEKLSSTRDEPAAGDNKISVRLTIDWKALGMDKDRSRLIAPPVGYFQPPAEFSPDEPIPVEASKGWLLILAVKE